MVRSIALLPRPMADFFDLIRSFGCLLRFSFQDGLTPARSSRGTTSPEPTDEELMERYSQKADVKAFEILLRRFRTELFGFLVRSCGDHALAEDLYQETFIRVIKAASTYSSSARFRTWIFTIARNLLTDHYRRQSVRRIVMPLNRSTDPDDEENADYPDRDVAPADARVASIEIAGALRDILAELPAEQREMFLLREEAGLDFKEAARVTGCSENTAKSRMRYALLKMRDEFTRRGLIPESRS